jgi:hypothetical protein
MATRTANIPTPKPNDKRHNRLFISLLFHIADKTFSYLYDICKNKVKRYRPAPQQFGTWGQIPKKNGFYIPHKNTRLNLAPC